MNIYLYRGSGQELSLLGAASVIPVKPPDCTE